MSVKDFDGILDIEEALDDSVAGDGSTSQKLINESANASAI
jgi:hypothetical protein